MGRRRRCIITTIAAAGCLCDIVDVGNGVALVYGDMLVTIGNGNSVPALCCQVIGPVAVVIGPVCKGLLFACCRTVIRVVRLVYDCLTVDFRNLTRPAIDNAIVSCYTTGAGANVVGVTGISGSNRKRNYRSNFKSW